MMLTVLPLIALPDFTALFVVNTPMNDGMPDEGGGGPPPFLIKADIDDARDSGGGSAGDHAAGFPGERFVVEMRVGVYEFHGGIIA